MKHGAFRKEVGICFYTYFSFPGHYNHKKKQGTEDVTHNEYQYNDESDIGAMLTVIFYYRCKRIRNRSCNGLLAHLSGRC